MRKNAFVSAAALLMMCAVTAAPALAQTTKDKADVIDPARVRELIKQATQPPQPTPAPVPTSQPFVTPGPRVDLSLQDAVARARDKNIDIAVARITPRLTDFTIAGLEANYRPNLTSSANTARVNQPVSTASQGTSGTTQLTQTASWNGGLAQNLWWGGGNYSVGWQNSRQARQSANNLRNPQFSSNLTLNLTQPLMRGFGIDSTRAALQTDRISQQNDEITLQTTIESTDASTRNAYWDLVFAIQAVDAAQASFDLAGKLVQDNQARVEIGTLAPIDITSAQSEQATRRSTLVSAQATLRTSELALKRLIVSGTDDPLWTSSLNPVDRPPATAEPINLDSAVARALRERTDLAQSINNLKISDINLRNQVDATRPQLNLTANYGLSGLGGPFTPTAIDPITGLRINQPVVNSGYLDALRNILGLDVPQFTVGFNFAYPLGQSAQQATVARSKLSVDQSNANLKALQLQIATDVTNAALTVQSSLESVQASASAREFAQKKLEAAQQKFDVGMAINYEVVQAQRDFADAQNAELRAVLNYRKALVNFETSQTIGARGVGAAVGSTGGGTTTTTTGGTTTSGGGTTIGGGTTTGGGGL